MKKILLFVATIICLGFTATAQKPVLLSSSEEITEAAKKEFQTSMQEGGALHEFGVKNNIKGEYYFDITIGDKKRVVTVFAIGNDSDDIKSQNALRDFLKGVVFTSFKVPKDKRYKYEQTLYFE